MLYSITEYQQEFHPTKSYRTVLRMIKSKLIDENHTIIQISGVILIDTSPQADLKLFLCAIETYCRRMKIPVNLELATECGQKFNVKSQILLNRFLGYKKDQNVE